MVVDDLVEQNCSADVLVWEQIMASGPVSDFLLGLESKVAARGKGHWGGWCNSRSVASQIVGAVARLMCRRPEARGRGAAKQRINWK